MISQFFILSPRGDPIIFRDFRHELPRSMTEVFFKEAKKWKDVSGTQPPPAIKSGDVSFLYIRRNSLYFVASTKFNVSPLMIIELLSRLAGLFKDYCGVLNEEALRMNFTLAYEILDEVIDHGYPQGTSTEMLKSYIYNEPVAVEKTYSSSKVKTQNTIPSTAAERPISSTLEDKRKTNQSSEVFVDLFEKMTVVVAANGNIVRSSIDGKLQIKSFLSSNPEIRMGLNEDLAILDEGPRRQGYGFTALDDCKFHECVDLTEFDRERIIVIRPPHGEFTAMSYCISRDIPYGIPFQLITLVNVIEETKAVEINLSLRSEVPPTISAVNVAVRLNVPKSTTNVSCDPLASGEKYEYRQQDKQFTWHLKKILGGSTSECKVKILVSEVSRYIKKEIGSICVDFEIPMYVCSGLQIRFMKVLDRSQLHAPKRWVRYITHSDSYVFRL